MLSQFSKTRRRIGELVNAEPFGGAGRTFCSPLFVGRNPGIKYVNILDAHRIAGTHHGGNVMRVKDVFQYHRQVGLAFVQYGGEPFVSFRGHKSKYNK